MAESTADITTEQAEANMAPVFVMPTGDGVNRDFLATLDSTKDDLTKEEIAEFITPSSNVNAKSFEEAKATTTTDKDEKQVENGSNTTKADTKTDSSIEPDLETGIFGKILGEVKTVDAPKDLTEGVTVFKNKHGIDVTSLEGVIELNNKWEDLSKRAETSEKASQELEKFRNQILGFPEDLKAAILAIEAGQDYKTAFAIANGTQLDYSLSVDKHNAYKLVKEMLPKTKLTEEDFEDYPESDSVVDAIELAREKYVLKQNSITQAENGRKLKEQEAVASMTRSIDSAFKKAIDTFGDTPEIRDIHKKITEGKFEELFFNDKGFAEDGISKLVYAEHAPKFIQKQQEAMVKLREANKSLSNQLAELAGKSATNVELSRGQGNGMAPELAEKMNTIQEDETSKQLQGFEKYQESKKKDLY